MQNERKQTLRSGVLVGAVLVGALTVVLMAKRAWATDPPQPVLSISQIDSNVFQIIITNAASYANYEIYRRAALSDPIFPWTSPITGALGQATFTVTNLNFVNLQEFFRAGVGSDWDLDGVLNWQDSQPSSTNGGLLRITVAFPASNGNVP